MKVPTISVRVLGLAVVAAAMALVLASGTNAAPLTEVTKLTASDAQGNTRLGFSAAISGDTAIVGAVQDALGGAAGAAYVFERNVGGPDNWGEVKKLIASDAQGADQFGWSIAISGDTAIVGAVFEDAGGTDAGAAYIFERNQGGPDNWGQVKKLTASGAQAGDLFGQGVGISGDAAIVGANGEDAGGANAGAAYVFERNQGGPGNWGEVKKLTASDGFTNDQFGIAAAIAGDTAVVGAIGEDAGVSPGTGAAYMFQRDQGGPNNWGEVKKVTASDGQGGDLFGFSAAVNGDTAILGALDHDGVGFNAGTAYVFERNQGGPDNWGEVQKLTASVPQVSAEFGVSVAISGDSAIVGAHQDDTSAGAAYEFERDLGGPNNWGEVQKLTASDATQALDNFGKSVGISGNTAIVGALFQDAAAMDAGAAYVFEAPKPPTPTSTATATPLPTDTPVPPVGGIAVDPDLGALALETAGSSGNTAGLPLGIVAAVATGVVALAVAAWYARRRVHS